MCVYVCMYACMYVCMCVCVCIYTHTFIYKEILSNKIDINDNTKIIGMSLYLILAIIDILIETKIIIIIIIFLAVVIIFFLIIVMPKNYFERWSYLIEF